MRARSIIVRAVWDPEAEVCVATSADVPGLLSKLDVLIPELLEADAGQTAPRPRS